MAQNILYIGEAEFTSEVLQSSRPVAVDFFSDECPPCEALAPIFEKMSDIYGDKMKFVKIFRQENRALAERLGVKGSPTVLFFQRGQETGARLTGFIKKPDLRMAIEKVLGIDPQTKELTRESFDLIILGGGPAGLSAALYAGRAKLNTVVVDEGVTGGQARNTYHIANYPGTGEVVRGKDLMDKMLAQARFFGARVDDLKEVSRVDLAGEMKKVETEDIIYEAPAIIIATGAQPRKLPAEGEENFRGRGVHYCATCDGAMYPDKKLIVVGGGNSAVEEAVFLTRFAAEVTVAHQFDHFQASQTAQEQALKNDKIKVIWDSEVRLLHGDSHLTGITLENVKTGATQEMPADGVFVYIGTEPQTYLFRDQLVLDKAGYIKTDQEMQTGIPGVYAAGDIRTKTFRQAITAASDGVVAALNAEKYIYSKPKQVPV